MGSVREENLEVYERATDGNRARMRHTMPSLSSLELGRNGFYTGAETTP